MREGNPEQTCPAGDFTIRYYPNGDLTGYPEYGCQPLSLPALEDGGPFFAGEPRSMSWEGQISFTPNTYEFQALDSGMRVTLQKAGVDPEVVLTTSAPSST